MNLIKSNSGEIGGVFLARKLCVYPNLSLNDLRNALLRRLQECSTRIMH